MGRSTTTCYRHEEARCSNRQCRRWVRQAGEGEILRAKIGPEMRARGLFLRFDIGLPFRKVVAAIEGLDSPVASRPRHCWDSRSRRRKRPGRWPTTWP